MKLFTPEQACNFLEIKMSRLRSAIYKKEITYRKIGRLIRLTQEDLEAFANKQVVEAKKC